MQVGLRHCCAMVVSFGPRYTTYKSRSYNLNNKMEEKGVRDESKGEEWYGREKERAVGGNKEGSGSRKEERRVNEVREEWERGRRVGEWSRRRQRERERSDVGSGSNAAGERRVQEEAELERGLKR